MAVAIALAGASIATAGCADPRDVKAEVTDDDQPSPLRSLLPTEEVLLASEAVTGGAFYDSMQQPSMAFCDGDLPSQGRRIEQRAVSVGPDYEQLTREEIDETGLGDYVFASATRFEPGQAKVALDELRLAIARCDPETWLQDEELVNRRNEVHATSIEVDGLPEDHVVTGYTELIDYGPVTEDFEKLLVSFRRGDVVVTIDGAPVRAEVFAEQAATTLASLPATEVGE